jgi:2-amino-4-hydroxy-6-hydroxymethyldihydropteridine diphosphokinase
MDPAWLLLLGSNRPTEATLRMALARLAELGPVSVLAPIQRFPADSGTGGDYFNALARWQMAGALPDVVARLKALESALGRTHKRADDVAVDIDVLAAQVNGTWLATPHALDKGEFGRATVAALLRQAGVEVRNAAPGEQTQMCSSRPPSTGNTTPLQ